MRPISLFTFCLLMALNGFSQPGKGQKDTSGLTFTKAETAPQFPGGNSAWAKFLTDSLHYPKAALEKRVEGTVWVQFVVDTAGDRIKVEAFSGPQELREEAERIIKISPKWIPATQNGWIVNCYQKQAVNFKLK